MHFVLAWEVKTGLPGKTQIENELIAAITGRSFVRALSNVFIVKVGSQLEADSIRETLVGVCQKHTPHANFIMSPLMDGGSYRGFLPRNLWEEIQVRTK